MVVSGVAVAVVAVVVVVVAVAVVVQSGRQKLLPVFRKILFSSFFPRNRFFWKKFQNFPKRKETQSDFKMDGGPHILSVS